MTPIATRFFPLTAGALAALALVAAPRRAHAFAEDLCYIPGGGPIQSCAPLPAACLPAGTISPACYTAILATDAAQGSSFDSGRSSVHTDITFLLAEAVGFSETDAYWIAAYDEATDLGSFEPRDNSSVVVGTGEWATADIGGLVRGDFTSGGVLLHFVSPYNNGSSTPPAGINGLAPDPTNAATEPTLANFRAWALAASSSAKPACTAGLTIQSPQGDYATGAACYATGTPIHGSIASIQSVPVPIQATTSLQVIQDPSGGPQTFAPMFDALVATDGAGDTSATHAQDARLGVYLHVLADRITHHVCTDQSVIAGPNAFGFQIAMTNADCDQPIHLLRHAWETGTNFAQLAAQDRTTEAMLVTIYTELVTIAKQRGVLRTGADSMATQTAYTSALAHALQQYQCDRSCHGDRRAVACTHKLTPFKGQPACP